MSFIFIRHPETVANIQGIIYGKKDYPYTILGYKQMEEVLKKLENISMDCIVTSPLGRAMLLANNIGELKNMSLIEDERLEEMNHGILEGLTENDARARYPEVLRGMAIDNYNYVLPEGESYKKFYKRVDDFIDEWSSYTGVVLVVSHGGVIRTAIEKLLGDELELLWELELGNCSIVYIENSNGNWVMKK